MTRFALVLRPVTVDTAVCLFQPQTSGVEKSMLQLDFESQRAQLFLLTTQTHASRFICVCRRGTSVCVTACICYSQAARLRVCDRLICSCWVVLFSYCVPVVTTRYTRESYELKRIERRSDKGLSVTIQVPGIVTSECPVKPQLARA